MLSPLPVMPTTTAPVHGKNTPGSSQELLTLKGEVILQIIDHETGHQRWHRAFNALTNQIKTNVASFLTGGTTNQPNYIAVGTGIAAGYASSNQDTDKKLTSSGADQQLGQGFKISAAYNISHVHLWIKRVGTSVGTLRIEIQTDAAGLPSGTVVANGTSDNVSINGVTLAYQWVKFSFPVAFSLSAATQYHIVLKSTGYTFSSGVTEVIWGVDQSAPSYADGQVTTYDGTTWTNATAADACFRIITQTDSSYTALLGELDRNIMSSRTNPSTNVARLLASFSATEAVEHWGHMALHAGAAGGTCQAIINLDLDKTNQMTINCYWVITVG